MCLIRPCMHVDSLQIKMEMDDGCVRGRDENLSHCLCRQPPGGRASYSSTGRGKGSPGRESRALVFSGSRVQLGSEKLARKEDGAGTGETEKKKKRENGGREGRKRDTETQLLETL